MSNPKLLIPVRVPELGPFLGKVITGTGCTPGGLQLDAVRYRLVTRLFERAGEARRLAGREERQAALATIGRTAWLEAWDEAVSTAGELLAERVSGRLESEALAVRLPRRKRRRLQLDEAERRALNARLGSAGAVLVPALDRLEQRASLALDATAVQREAVEAWQDALRTSARRMEAAWFDLERRIQHEWERWAVVADGVASWRGHWWLFGLGAVVLLGAALYVGLVWGGYVELPRWLATLGDGVGER